MKIILDNIIFQLQVSGGISNYWFQLIKNLTSESNLEISFFGDKHTDNIFRNLIDLNTYPNLGIQNFPFSRYLNPKLEKQDYPAIFHSSYYRTSQNKKHINITTVHDFTYERFIKTPQSYAHKIQKKKAILNSDGIICISENTKRDLLKFVPELKKSQKVIVIPHGVSSNSFKVLPANENIIPMPTKFSSGEYIVYVGDRKASYKNFDKAAKVAHKTKLPLVIIGGGALQPHELTFLENPAYKMAYEHKAKVDNQTLNWFYNNAFALLYPSAYEGFGLPVVEAQLAGCPVIALNDSSIPEVAGDAAILVNENSVEAFVKGLDQLKDFKLRTELIDKGFKNAAKFTWQNTFNQTLEFYKELYKTS